MIELNVTGVDPNPCKAGGICFMKYDNTPLKPFFLKGEPTSLTLLFTVGNLQVVQSMFDLAGLVQFVIPDGMATGMYDVEMVVRVQVREMMDDFRIQYTGLEVKGTDHDNVNVRTIIPTMLNISDVKEVKRFSLTFSGDNIDKINSVASLSGPATGGRIVQFRLMGKSVSRVMCQAMLTDAVVDGLQAGNMRFKIMTEDGREVTPNIGVMLYGGEDRTKVNI